MKRITACFVFVTTVCIASRFLAAQEPSDSLLALAISSDTTLLMPYDAPNVRNGFVCRPLKSWEKKPILRTAVTNERALYADQCERIVESGADYQTTDIVVMWRYIDIRGGQRRVAAVQIWQQRFINSTEQGPTCSYWLNRGLVEDDGKTNERFLSRTEYSCDDRFEEGIKYLRRIIR